MGPKASIDHGFTAKSPGKFHHFPSPFPSKLDQLGPDLGLHQQVLCVAVGPATALPLQGDFPWCRSWEKRQKTMAS